MPLTVVYIRDGWGREYATNVDGETVEEAVNKAVEFFRDPFWRGPKPKPGMVLRVCQMGGESRYVTL